MSFFVFDDFEGFFTKSRKWIKLIFKIVFSPSLEISGSYKEKRWDHYMKASRLLIICVRINNIFMNFVWALS